MVIVNFSLVLGVASFAITSFSCTPSESAINDVFSCTAQIKNNGDVAGSVSTATLYSDSANWLENSNYPQASGASVSPGQSTEVTFAGLRAVKSGNNGFSKIMLDSVTDTYVADNNKKVNVVDVAVTVSDSASSAAMNAEFTSTAEVTAGGNIDVILTFSVSSGGCSLGSQSSQKTITGMQDGNKQSRTWTVTQGTSGNCQYSISAAATGDGGVASKTDTTPSSVSCTDCPTSSTTTSAGGGGGGGGSGKTYTIGELSEYTKELAANEKLKFNISNKQHTLTMINMTETAATISIESEKQTFILGVGDEVKVDLNKDNLADVSIKLKSINILTKYATLILNKVSGAVPPSQSSSEQETAEEAAKAAEEAARIKSRNLIIYGVIILAVIILVVLFIIYRRRYS